jgi:putative oxidoreductase
MPMDLGLLLLRVIVGLFYAGHGAQKLFGWFGGIGFAGFSGWMGSIGLRPTGAWALLGGLAELGGGLLLALGLLSPLGSLGIVASMATATVLVHWPRLWAADNGVEVPVINSTAAIAVALVGPGVYSLDALLGIAVPEVVSRLVLALVLIGVIVTGVMASTARRSAARIHLVEPAAEAA